MQGRKKKFVIEKYLLVGKWKDLGAALRGKKRTFTRKTWKNRVKRGVLDFTEKRGGFLPVLQRKRETRNSTPLRRGGKGKLKPLAKCGGGYGSHRCARHVSLRGKKKENRSNLERKKKELSGCIESNVRRVQNISAAGETETVRSRKTYKRKSTWRAETSHRWRRQS